MKMLKNLMLTGILLNSLVYTLPVGAASDNQTKENNGIDFVVKIEQVVNNENNEIWLHDNPKHFVIPAFYLDDHGYYIKQPVYGILDNGKLFIDVDSFIEMVKPELLKKEIVNYTSLDDIKIISFRKNGQDIRLEYSSDKGFIIMKESKYEFNIPTSVYGSINDNEMYFVPVRQLSELLSLNVRYEAPGTVYVSNEEQSVNRKWIKEPWLHAMGIKKGIMPSLLNQHPSADIWLTELLTPWGDNWLFSYNQVNDNYFTSYSLLDYAVILKAPTTKEYGEAALFYEDSKGEWQEQKLRIKPVPEFKEWVKEPWLQGLTWNSVFRYHYNEMKEIFTEQQLIDVDTGEVAFKGDEIAEMLDVMTFDDDDIRAYFTKGHISNPIIRMFYKDSKGQIGVKDYLLKSIQSSEKN